jgi:hypothetical protein
MYRLANTLSGNEFAAIPYAGLQGGPRGIAYPIRSLAGGLWKFLGFRDANDHAGGDGFGFDVAMMTQDPHPALERASVESGFLFDFVVADRRATEYPTEGALLARLAQHEPAVEPQRRAHFLVVPRLEKHTA